MENELVASVETKFPKEVINHQLQRIFQDPLFMNSDILRRFLSFIVEQTLRGHADWLKEYTIGVNVLNKPSNFKPGEDGIVRIHAGRLRRALNHYYAGIGANDSVQISVPKGSYIPVFNDTAHGSCNQPSKPDHEITLGTNRKFMNDKSPVIAVIPFQHFNDESMENSLRDGLGLQLSTALMELERFSVIAYYTMRNLCEKTTEIPTIASLLGVQYFLTGNIQSMEGRVRIHAQMIHGQSSQQLWCCMYEGIFTPENIFDLQDQIVKLIISKIDVGKFPKEKTESVFITAVA